jgi:hypothetical protein
MRNIIKSSIKIIKQTFAAQCVLSFQDCIHCIRFVFILLRICLGTSLRIMASSFIDEVTKLWRVRKTVTWQQGDARTL